MLPLVPDPPRGPGLLPRCSSAVAAAGLGWAGPVAQPVGQLLDRTLEVVVDVGVGGVEDRGRALAVGLLGVVGGVAVGGDQAGDHGHGRR
ncbi:MAG: hypothetical protein QM714_19495 [Nocardioides sp.]|uniref:hypothetical protein n=1 Tax=Nocardioides sp. TaxID=35761 RepID=UPI0039E5B5DA